MTLRGKAEIFPDSTKPLVRVLQEPLRLLYLFLENKFGQSHAALSLEFCRKVSSADEHGRRHILNTRPYGDIPPDVLDHLADEP